MVWSVSFFARWTEVPLTDAKSLGRIGMSNTVQPSVSFLEHQNRGLISAADRRAEVRFPTNCAAKLRVLSPSAGVVADAHVVNASMSGARIRTDAELDVGMIVQVSFQNSILVGEVRNCSIGPDGHEAGLYVSVFYDREDPTTHAIGTRIRPIVKPS